ncbi:MAG: PAS domain-containing sensor histidine kinase [Alphaproteobacteria bacterium]|nr:PAS domain-containing sensor histidine kinase [Alphaproteobacteria bacterium]
MGWFEALAEVVPSILWTAAPDGSVDYCNRSGATFSGARRAALLGWGWQSVIHREDRERTLSKWRHALADGAMEDLEHRLRRHDGAYRWHLSRAVAQRDGAGRIVRWFGASVDIHPRVEAERDLDGRDGEMSQARLDRMAALGCLSAGLGHDMGNLLLPVRVRLDTIEARGIPDPMRDDLRVIRKSVELLQRLTNGLRLLSLDPDQNALCGDNLDPLEWWADSEAVLRNGLPRRVELAREFPDDPPRLAIARHRLTQVVFNLVQNAGEAMREGGAGTVTVRLSAAERGLARLSVADDGPGMTREVMRRCLEPFFTTKTRGISTGMGLALVDGMVKQSGGSIEIQSAPGLGTVFTLLLRTATDPAARQEDRTAHVALPDARIRTYVGGVLRAMGYALVDGDGEGATLWITDDAAAAAGFVAEARGRSAVVFADVPAGPGLVPLGPRPRPEDIRQALRGLGAGG